VAEAVAVGPGVPPGQGGGENENEDNDEEAARSQAPTDGSCIISWRSLSTPPTDRQLGDDGPM